MLRATFAGMLLAFAVVNGAQAADWIPRHPWTDQTGRTPEGVFFETFSDGVVWLDKDEDILTSYNQWRVTCRNDAMTDVLSCIVGGPFDKFEGGKPQNGGLTLSLDASGSITTTCVSSHTDPRHRAMIRVDREQAIETSEEGCLSGNIPGFETGTDVTTRRWEFPYDARDKRETLINYRRAVELAQAMLRTAGERTSTEVPDTDKFSIRIAEEFLSRR